MAAVLALDEIEAIPEMKRWTVDQFVRLYESGELGGEDERFELVDGEIWRKLSQNDSHVTSVRLTADALRAVFGEGFVVDQQLAFRLGGGSRPEPDVSVVRGSARNYAERTPAAADVVMMVEVADSRLDLARGKKVAVYAQNRIPEYWIIDLRRRAVEVRRGPLPADESWSELHIFFEDDSITPLHAGGATVAVRDLLPRATAEEPTPNP